MIRGSDSDRNKSFCLQNAHTVCDLPNLQFSGYRGYFPKVNRPGHEAVPLFPSSADINTYPANVENMVSF